MTDTRTITAEDLAGFRIHGHRVTNLGPGFQIDLEPGTATTLTVDRQAGTVAIAWINTYGNVIHNGGQYAFDAEAEAAAEDILDRHYAAWQEALESSR